MEDPPRVLSTNRHRSKTECRVPQYRGEAGSNNRPSIIPINYVFMIIISNQNITGYWPLLRLCAAPGERRQSVIVDFPSMGKFQYFQCHIVGSFNHQFRTHRNEFGRIPKGQTSRDGRMDVRFRLGNQTQTIPSTHTIHSSTTYLKFGADSN